MDKPELPPGESKEFTKPIGVVCLFVDENGNFSKESITVPFYTPALTIARPTVEDVQKHLEAGNTLTLTSKAVVMDLI